MAVSSVKERYQQKVNAYMEKIHSSKIDAYINYLLYLFVLIVLLKCSSRFPRKGTTEPFSII